MAENTITFKVLGMTCTMCALTIEKQLSDQEGVTSANVNFALGHATVTYVPKEIAPKQLVQAIRDVGYDVDIERAELEMRASSVLRALTPSKTLLRKSQA
ncbi:MAG: heavy-metal-associated domain-containing protein [Halobacteriota archaeon]